MFELERFAERMKLLFPAGSRIECDYCNDPWSPIKGGERGTVECVDDIGTVHVRFDNGRRLGLVMPEDGFHKVRK